MFYKLISDLVLRKLIIKLAKELAKKTTNTYDDKAVEAIEAVLNIEGLIK